MASVADPENAVEQQEELRRFQCPRTKVEAVDIGVCANGHALLSRVSASFEPESVTAVLGESGCGKSALLRVIGGGRHDSGQILFNGCGVSRLNSRFLVYFLRDDCHFEALTVAQTLCYASMLRNVDSPKKRIGALMSLLSIKDEIVGNMPRGRRKLVSICAQLLSTRPVLVMDEPTTGLDAATAMKIVGVIRNAEAYETRTVIASLHQPSWLLLNAFTGVMVLANGRVVFHGSPTEMASYFDSFPSSQNIVHIVNPADRAIYALEEGEGDEDNDSTWAKRWEDARRSRLLERIYNLSDEDDEDGFDEFYFSTTSAFILSPWQQYKILAVRACHVWFQDSARAQTAYTLAILVSCFAGIAQFMSGWTPSKMNVLAFFAAGTFLSATLPSAVSQSLDCVVARREWQNGIHSTGSYWLAHCTVALASSFVVASLVIPIVSTTLALPLETVLCLKYWIALVIHYFNCSVFGLLCGTLTSSSGAALQIMSISMASMFLTCGAIMPLHRMHTVFLPCRYPNLFTWYFRIILTLTFGHANDEAWELLTSSGYMDIDPGHEKMWWFAQLFIGVALILLGYLSTHITLQRSDKYSVEPDPLKVKIWRTKALVAPEDQAESRSESLVSKSKKEEKSYGAVLSMATGRREGSRISTYDLWFWHRGILNREKDKRFDKTTSQGHLAKATLKGVNVTFDASTATAILGPSGSGKSTLMDVVGGRTSGVSQGSVLVDGKPLNSEILRTTSTFTPQNEDGLPSVLTVREILTYAGMLRSQSRLSHRSCAATLAKVEEVAACLGLSEKMDRVVGTSTSFGLSSGEKKRLSIGMDVLAERKIMVVDEPTTGLDSISAMAVTNALLQLSRLVTVVCPIQQPPWPLLCKFDKIAFLNAGRVVYCGLPSSFQQYISDCGWAPCPVDENPAEHFMLVLTTSTDTAEWHEKWESCRRGEELAQTAKNEYLSFSTSGKFDFAEAPRLDNDYLLTGVMPTMAVAKALSSIRTSYSAKTAASSVSYRLSLCEQYLVLTHRCWTVSLKDGSIARLLISSAQMGLLIGLLFYNFAPRTIYAGLCVFCGIASQALIVLNGGVCFVDASERLSIIRDFRGGAHAAWVYWLARATVTTVAVAIVSIVQVPVWWYLFGLNLHPWCVSDMICNSFLLATAFGHVACLIGIVEPNHLRACQLTFPIVAISFLTSGSLILRSQSEVEFRPVYWINPLSSAFQNAMNAAFRNDNSAQLLRYYEIKPGTEVRNYAILISWIVLLLAFGCFVVSHAIERQSRRLSTVA